MIFLWLSAAIMGITAAAHSILGEKRLIGPLLALDIGVMSSALARSVTRFAWHLTTVLMLLSALLVIWPGSPRPLVVITGGAWLAAGLTDAIMTRGRHIGWPMLTAAGVLALAGGAEVSIQ